MRNLSAYRWRPQPLTTRLVPPLAGLALLATAAPVQAQTATFVAVVNTSTGTGSKPYSVAVANVNGDGKPDALLTNSFSSNLAVLLNTTVFAPTLTSLGPTSGLVGHLRDPNRHQPERCRGRALYQHSGHDLQLGRPPQPRCCTSGTVAAKACATAWP